MELEYHPQLVPNIFLFAYRRCHPDWTIQRAVIDFHDLTFVVKGKAEYWINGEKYTAEAGDLIYVPEGSVREAYTYKETPMHAYPFNFHWAEPYNHVHLPFGVITKKLVTKEIYGYIYEFNQVWMSKQPFYMFKARALFELILHQLLHNYYRQSTTQIDPRIQKLTAYITEHYFEEITIRDLAEMVNLHPVYLGKLFKQHTGVTYKEYLNRVRINHAEMMLSEGNLTVTEAAELCGFNDISYFSNVFKEMKGYPPSVAKKHAP